MPSGRSEIKNCSTDTKARLRSPLIADELQYRAVKHDGKKRFDDKPRVLTYRAPPIKPEFLKRKSRRCWSAEAVCTKHGSIYGPCFCGGFLMSHYP